MTPTVGRILLCMSAALIGERPAIITGVNPDGTIDIAPQLRPQDIRQSGDNAVGNVAIHENAEAAKAAVDASGGPLWAAFWMPYQVGQAAKTEEAEEALRVAIVQLQDRLDAGAEAQRDVNTRHQKAIDNLATTKEAGPMGGRLASAILALASACSGDQQQAIKNILEGVEATPAE